MEDASDIDPTLSSEVMNHLRVSPEPIPPGPGPVMAGISPANMQVLTSEKHPLQSNMSGPCLDHPPSSCCPLKLPHLWRISHGETEGVSSQAASDSGSSTGSLVPDDDGWALEM